MDRASGFGHYAPLCDWQHYCILVLFSEISRVKKCDHSTTGHKDCKLQKLVESVDDASDDF